MAMALKPALASELIIQMQLRHISRVHWIFRSWQKPGPFLHRFLHQVGFTNHWAEEILASCFSSIFSSTAGGVGGSSVHCFACHEIGLVTSQPLTQRIIRQVAVFSSSSTVTSTYSSSTSCFTSDTFSVSLACQRQVSHMEAFIGCYTKNMKLSWYQARSKESRKSSSGSVLLSLWASTPSGPVGSRKQY